MYNIVQVLWLGHPDCVTTWEPATALSPSLIADYEAGVLKEAASKSQEAYGLCNNSSDQEQTTTTSGEEGKEGRMHSAR